MFGYDVCSTFIRHNRQLVNDRRMVNLSNVAIFVLATTKSNMGGQKQDYHSYFESRILPISHTYGAWFDHLFFVMGANLFDYEFIQANCIVSSTRRLAPHSPQTPFRNAIELYTCNTGAKQKGLKATTHFNVLWTANCTGEYFGLGPTCRCQEAMRYFNTAPPLHSAEWFVFTDDDVHLRPHAVVSMLNELSNRSDVQKPVAVVAPTVLRDFGFSKAATQGCKIPGVHQFLCAQPAFINKSVPADFTACVDLLQGGHGAAQGCSGCERLDGAAAGVGRLARHPPGRAAVDARRPRTEFAKVPLKYSFWL